MDVLGFEEQGIHLALMQKEKMDSRLRGNDVEAMTGTSAKMCRFIKDTH